MKVLNLFVIVPWFASLATAANHHLPRAIGSYCDAPEGTGTCQKTSNCEGIAYPNNYCPQDPVDVQCCVPKKCSAPHTASLCRHTAQGCKSGSFVPGYCPGDSSIQCCVQSASADKPSCSNPAENTCTFYPNCLEKAVQCGASGYPLGYGLKYCTKFTSASPQFSSTGRAWITKTMLCLQRALVPYATAQSSTTCANLKEFAFGTHPGCYVSSGVCALPPQDWEVIIGTVSLKELFGSLDALKATLQTGEDCAKFYEWLIERGIIKVVEEVKDGVESVWKKVVSWF